MTDTLKSDLSEELKYLQRQYYLIDKINKNNNSNYSYEKGKKRIFEYNDYADKNIIYNHPQLYYINKNKKNFLPKLNFSIKRKNLTNDITDKAEIINHKNLMKLSNFIKMNKSKKPKFIG